MPYPPIVALEIGTSKVVAVVGEMREDANIMISGVGEHPSVGVRKGEVIDLENAAICARAAMEAAEESSQVAIRQVHVAVTGGHIQSLVNRGAVPVLDRRGEITQDDIDQVMDVARAVNLSSDREVLHTICQHFCVDEQEHVVKPEGMAGARLALDMLVLQGVRNRLRNTVKVAETIPVDVQDVVFSGLCSALSVLTPEQKQSGAVVIDIGAGTTEYLAYAGNVVASAGVLGVGGDHVTNDIAIGFSIPMSQAEELKRESGSAMVNRALGLKKVTVPPEVGFPGRSILLTSLHTVMHARVDEMLSTIRKRLEDAGILVQLGAGVVLVGGGAHMRDICSLAESIFGLPCSVGKPRNVSGLAIATEGPEYATCSGLVQYGFRTHSNGTRGPGLGGWLGKLFGR